MKSSRNRELSPVGEDTGEAPCRAMIQRVMSERIPVIAQRSCSFEGMAQAMDRRRSEKPSTGQESRKPILVRALSDRLCSDTLGDARATSRVVRRAAYAAAARHRQRHRNTISLGSHVSWQDLLELAGDDEESWRAKKVHRWLGVSEDIGVSLLAELLELKQQLAEEGEQNCTSSSSTTVTQQEAPGGFFSWMFGGGGSSPSRDAPVDKPSTTAAGSEPDGGGSSSVLSWFFGGLACTSRDGYGRPANFQLPPKIIHRNSIEYKFEELEELGCLGNGAFGAVTLVRCRSTRQTFALKAVSKGLIVEQQLQANIKNEKVIMQSMYCPFLVKLAATFNRLQFVYLLMEPCMGGDLYTVFRQEDLFGSQDHARFYATCVSSAFEHMHSRSIIYRDLKMENLVLDVRGYCKLCDFGTSVFAFPWAYTLCGTPEYMAPEVVTGRGYSNTVDWWALGILVYEMLMGETPFVADEPLQILRNVRQGIESVDFPADYSWNEFVRGLCAQKPDSRLPALDGGIRNVKEQAWFTEVDFPWEQLEKCQMLPPHVPQVENPEDLRNFMADEQELPDRIDFGDSSSWEEVFLDFEDPIGPANIYDEPLTPRSASEGVDGDVDGEPQRARAEDLGSQGAQARAPLHT